MRKAFRRCDVSTGAVACRSARVAAGLVVLFVIPLLPGSRVRQARGQVMRQTLSPSQREQLYRSVALNAARLEEQNHLKRIIRLIEPTVVHIEAEKGDEGRLASGHGSHVEEAGAGVLVDFDGRPYVLTNFHVVRTARRGAITVKLYDGREIHPTTVLADPETDIAILAISANQLVTARLGNSNQMEIGDFVLAVGSPFGLSHSVTYGIVSAKGRHDLQLGKDEVKFQNFIQTDAAINPGNSGGPLINLRGEVIGINTAIASASGGDEGVAFSIPINMIKVIARQLIEHGRVMRAFLGVKLDSSFNSARAIALGLSRLRGTRISGVTAGSPAEQAHLQVDDIILAFNGVDIVDDNHLVNLVGLTAVGKDVPVRVYRNGTTLTVHVKVGPRSQFDPDR